MGWLFCCGKADRFKLTRPPKGAGANRRKPARPLYSLLLRILRLLAAVNSEEPAVTLPLRVEEASREKAQKKQEKGQPYDNGSPANCPRYGCGFTSATLFAHLAQNNILAPMFSTALAVLVVAMGSAVGSARGRSPHEDVQKLVINYGGGGWKDNQVQEPCILVNPKDPHKLIMFYGGATTQAKGGIGSLGKAWADVSDPWTWHEDPENPIFRSDPKIVIRIRPHRRGDYNQPTDEYRIYYTGHSAQTHTDAIGLATCPAGDDGYKAVTAARATSNGMSGTRFYPPAGRDAWMRRAFRRGPFFGNMDRGIRSIRIGQRRKPFPASGWPRQLMASIWKKEPGPDLLTAAPETLYFEWHQVYKIGNRYVMLLEGYNGGTHRGADVAISEKLTSGWRKLPTTLIDQTTWPGSATPPSFTWRRRPSIKSMASGCCSCKPPTRGFTSSSIGRCIVLSSMILKDGSWRCRTPVKRGG